MRTHTVAPLHHGAEIALRRRLPCPRPRFLRNGAKPLRYGRISLIRHRLSSDPAWRTRQSVPSPRSDGSWALATSAGAEIRNPSMLPGFRFLFAAILLSASILVFGLGAAALLRATHEQYVSTPSWRNGPQEQVFAQASEPVQPVLAALRAEPEAAEPAPSLRDKIPTIGIPASEPEQVAAVTSDAEVQQSQVADAAPADDPAAEAAKTETAAPATSDTLSPADTTASIAEVKAAPTTTSEPTPTDNSAAQISSAPDIASAEMATLNDPAPTASKDPPAK